MLDWGICFNVMYRPANPYLIRFRVKNPLASREGAIAEENSFSLVIQLATFLLWNVGEQFGAEHPDVTDDKLKSSSQFVRSFYQCSCLANGGEYMIM